MTKKKTEPQPEPEITRYGVWDETLQQYVVGVYDSKGDASDAASAARKRPRYKGHKLIVREV